MMRLFDVESKLFNSNRFETAYKCRGLFNIVFSKGCCAQIPRYNRGGIKRHQVILAEGLRRLRKRQASQTGIDVPVHYQHK